jgi:hypothetical protein
MDLLEELDIVDPLLAPVGGNVWGMMLTVRGMRRPGGGGGGGGGGEGSSGVPAFGFVGGERRTRKRIYAILLIPKIIYQPKSSFVVPL